MSSLKTYQFFPLFILPPFTVSALPSPCLTGKGKGWRQDNGDGDHNDKGNTYIHELRAMVEAWYSADSQRSLSEWWRQVKKFALDMAGLLRDLWHSSRSQSPSLLNLVIMKHWVWFQSGCFTALFNRCRWWHCYHISCVTHVRYNYQDHHHWCVHTHMYTCSTAQNTQS